MINNNTIQRYELRSWQLCNKPSIKIYAGLHKRIKRCYQHFLITMIQKKETRMGYRVRMRVTLFSEIFCHEKFDRFQHKGTKKN